jgi:type IV pilus assembly protein PilP
VRSLGSILVIMIVFILGGCGGEPPKPIKVTSPPGAKKASAPSTTPGPVLPSADIKVEPPPPVTYIYNPKGKTDPFKPLVVEKTEVAPQPKGPEPSKVAEEEGATPLERVDLRQLKLVAVVWNIRDPKGNSQEPRAMVEDSAGRGYIINVGTSVGKNKGKVVQISATGIVVSERFDVGGGKYKMQEVPLKLYAE